MSGLKLISEGGEDYGYCYQDDDDDDDNDDDADDDDDDDNDDNEVDVDTNYMDGYLSTSLHSTGAGPYWGLYEGWQLGVQTSS